MTVDITDQCSQVACVLITVIHTADQAVLKCDPSPGLFEIVAAGIQYIMNFVFKRDRHQLFPFFLAGRMQRQRQRDLKLLIGEPSHIFHDSAR